MLSSLLPSILMAGMPDRPGKGVAAIASPREGNPEGGAAGAAGGVEGVLVRNGLANLFTPRGLRRPTRRRVDVLRLFTCGGGWPAPPIDDRWPGHAHSLAPPREGVIGKISGATAPGRAARAAAAFGFGGRAPAGRDGLPRYAARAGPAYMAAAPYSGNPDRRALRRAPGPSR